MATTNNNNNDDENPTKTQPTPDEDAADESKPAPALASDSGNDSSLSDADKKIRRPERFGITFQLSEEVKRNSRAERFGTTTTQGSETSKAEELKRKTRAERFVVHGPTTTADEEAKKKARLARFSLASKATADPTEENKRKAKALRFSNPSLGSLSQVNGEESIEPVSWKDSEMEEKGNQQESNAAALSTGGEPTIVTEGVPDIIASNSTISPGDTSSADPAIVIDGVPGIITNNNNIPPGDASRGESATVINEVADIIPSNKTLPSGNASSAAEMLGPSGLGKWLVGRKVQKWFEGQYYGGEVTKFEKWYRVLYEDGDSEDLDWLELEELLVPSEGKVPLKKLAKRVIKENKKSVHNSGKNIDCSENPQIKRTAKGKYPILPYKERLYFKI